MQNSLPGDVRVLPDVDSLMADLAAHLMARAINAIQDRGWFHLALSGGTTPEPFYIRLVTDPLYRAVPWGRTHVWMVDERIVPPDHEQSNFGMIRATLLEHLPMRRRQWHPMPVDVPGAAQRYAAELATGLGEKGRIDFALLGVGTDGHTASLFPRSSALAERAATVADNDGPTPTAPRRLTLTLPGLNACRDIAVLVTGGEKAALLQRVSGGYASASSDPPALPICGICPADGALTWFLDTDAASQL